MLSLVICESASVWDAYITRHACAPFPQSWAWGEHKRACGHEVRRYFLQDELGEIHLACQLIREDRAFGLMRYWFAPRGPVCAPSASTEQIVLLITQFYDALQKTDITSRAIFWRFEPYIRRELAIDWARFGWKSRIPSINPSTTRFVPLSDSEAMAADFHPKTRYNIRVAERDGVSVRLGNPADTSGFLQLMKETAERDGFIAHDASYLVATYKHLCGTGMARLRIAEHNGRMLAANLEIAYGDTVTYLHGASSSTDRRLMAPYLLHWKAMQEAAAEGYRFYDVWGANPAQKTALDYKPSWEGISRFKSGWGGFEISFAGTFDVPVHQTWYRWIV